MKNEKKKKNSKWNKLTEVDRVFSVRVKNLQTRHERRIDSSASELNWLVRVLRFDIEFSFWRKLLLGVSIVARVYGKMLHEFSRFVVEKKIFVVNDFWKNTVSFVYND